MLLFSYQKENVVIIVFELTNTTLKMNERLFLLLLFFFSSRGPFVIAKKMKNITWGSKEVITMPLEVNLEMEEAWYFSLFQSYTDEVILELP